MLYKSPLLTSASGSLSGLNASHNKGGNYFRSKPHPKNTVTNKRSRSRSALGALANFWNELTPSDRSTWDSYALDVDMPTRPGSIHSINGYNHFIRSNTARANLADEWEIISTAPSIYYLPPHLTPDATYIFRIPGGANEGQIYFGIIASTIFTVPVPDNLDLCFAYCSRPYNMGKSSYHSALTFVGHVIYPESPDDPLNVLFTTPFFNFPNTPFRMCLDLTYSFLDGRCSLPQRFFTSYPV